MCVASLDAWPLHRVLCHENCRWFRFLISISRICWLVGWRIRNTILIINSFSWFQPFQVILKIDSMAFLLLIEGHWIIRNNVYFLLLLHIPWTIMKVSLPFLLLDILCRSNEEIFICSLLWAVFMYGKNYMTSPSSLHCNSLPENLFFFYFPLFKMHNQPIFQII